MDAPRSWPPHPWYGSQHTSLAVWKLPSILRISVHTIYLYIYTYNFCHLINPSCPEESLNMTPAKTDFGSFGFPVKEWKESWKNHPKLDLMYMGVSKNRGTPKSSIFNRVFHNKPSILGVKSPYFWKHPYNERNFHQMVGWSILLALTALGRCRVLKVVPLLFGSLGWQSTNWNHQCLKGNVPFSNVSI